MKGSKTQNVTSTTVNPMQQLQMPFVEKGWNAAQDLYDKFSGAPGSSIATAGEPWMKEGYSNLYNTGAMLDQTLRPAANAFWQRGGEGSIYNSPAYQTYLGMTQPAQGSYATAPQQQIADLTQSLLNGARYTGETMRGWSSQLGANNNLGLSQLGQTAQGDYINGSPYFAQMVQNAMDPVTRNFQTAVAPQLDASFANSGRYGSGAMLGQRENAQNTLADNLAKMSQNMYGQNYATERGQQLAAAQQYGNLYNQGLAGAGQLEQAAGNAYQAAQQNAATMAQQRANLAASGAAGLQGGYQAGNAAALQAANQYPQLADAQYSQARNAVLAGQGLNEIQRQYINEPSDLLDRYLKQIGAVQGGSSSTTTPYFTNPMANAMSGISGGLGIMQQLGGMGGGMGGLGGYPATVNSPSGQWVNGTGMGSGIYTNMSNGITSDQPGSGFPGIGQVASGLGGLGSIASGIGSIFTGGWIICTELMRQGRMPWRYWAVGSKAFAAYPEVVQRGYYLWAIPVVRHLRRKPDSMLSRITGAVFRWRAEDLAARRGIKGARKLLRGRAVTWALYPICMALGSMLPEQDWQQVYRDDAGSRTAG